MAITALGIEYLETISGLSEAELMMHYNKPGLGEDPDELHLPSERCDGDMQQLLERAQFEAATGSDWEESWVKCFATHREVEKLYRVLKRLKAREKARAPMDVRGVIGIVKREASE